MWVTVLDQFFSRAGRCFPDLLLSRFGFSRRRPSSPWAATCVLNQRRRLLTSRRWDAPRHYDFHTGIHSSRMLDLSEGSVRNVCSDEPSHGWLFGAG